MPTLKQITCNVEWSGSNLPLHEYQTIYADGFVETYVAVPSVATAFSIHLHSHGYIAPGLAMFVYMDGDYQCNRNRSNLKIPSEARTWKQTEVDFQVRQKEELMPDGSFSGKQWKFESLKTDAEKRLAPHDAQYVGTIEVVVLRCYPTQPSTNLAPSRFVAESVRLAQPEEHSSPLAADTDTSSSSSSDKESTSSDSVASVMAGMFDGTADYAGDSSRSFSFGGDMALDQPSANHGKYQPRRSPYTGSNLGNADTRQSGNPSAVPIRYDQFYDSPDPQRWRNRVVPDPKGQNHENNKGRNPSSSSVRHSNYEPNKNHSDSQNRVAQNSPSTRAQRTPSGNDSNDRFSTSNRSRNSHTGNAATRTSPTSAWVQPQGPPAQAAPAVVINVSHGTPQPANFSSPANNQAINIESTKVDGWQNPSQHEKIDEYLEGTNRSPEGSNQSRASKRSNSSAVWPSQNYDQPKDISTEQDNAYEWHNTPNHEESNEKANENSWTLLEDTRNPNEGHGGSDFQNDNHAWDNNIVNSQPLESSSMEAQNNSNEWSSNENNNASNHTAWNADFGYKQAPHENSSAWIQPAHLTEEKSAHTPGSGQPKGTDTGGPGRAENSKFSVHPSPQGQVPQQPSSRSSYKTTFSKRTWANDAPNSQYPGINNHEAPQHVTPQPWSEHAVEPNNHVSGSPPPVAPQMYGTALPMFIDPRPRPHWSTWKQPQRSSSISKAVVPRVEPAEPLYYVPSEVAQRNKMSHQVYVSQPAEYVHKRASPRYMDEFSRPYAVFIFKYRSKAILEQILNTTLIEPEAQEKERLQDLSKEELIEQILKAKVYKDKSLSGSVSSSHTAKPEEPAYSSRDVAAAHDGRFASQKLPHPPKQAVQSSDNTSTNPEHHWGRRTPILNTAPPHPETKVANWLGGGGGGNQSYGASKNGSARDGNGDWGSGNKGTQNSVVGDWNKFQGAGAWTGNDDQHTVQHTVQQTTGDAYEEKGNGDAEVMW